MDDATKTYLDTKFAELNHGLGLVIWGDAPDNKTGPDGKPADKGGHPFNLEAIRGAETIQGKQIVELAASNKTLADLLAAQHPNLTTEQITEAVAAAVIRVQVSVDDGQPDPATAPAEGGV